MAYSRSNVKSTLTKVFNDEKKNETHVGLILAVSVVALLSFQSALFIMASSSSGKRTRNSPSALEDKQQMREQEEIKKTIKNYSQEQQNVIAKSFEEAGLAKKIRGEFKSSLDYIMHCCENEPEISKYYFKRFFKTFTYDSPSIHIAEFEVKKYPEEIFRTPERNPAYIKNMYIAINHEFKLKYPLFFAELEVEAKESFVTLTEESYFRELWNNSPKKAMRILEGVSKAMEGRNIEAYVHMENVVKNFFNSFTQEDDLLFRRLHTYHDCQAFFSSQDHSTELSTKAKKIFGKEFFTRHWSKILVAFLVVLLIIAAILAGLILSKKDGL